MSEHGSESNSTGGVLEITEPACDGNSKRPLEGDGEGCSGERSGAGSPKKNRTESESVATVEEFVDAGILRCDEEVGSLLSWGSFPDDDSHQDFVLSTGNSK